MDALLRHLKVLVRAESLVAEIRMHRIIRQTGLVAFACLVALFGLAMLDVAAYQAMIPRMGEASAAATVAGGDFLLALVLLLLAALGSRRQQIDLAIELRQSAWSQIETQMQAAHGLLSGLGRHPLEAVLPKLLAPLLTLLISALRKHKDQD